MEEHPGSRGMYDAIAQWGSCSVVWSESMRWDRFGILGVLGDYVLRYVKG